MNFNYTIVSGDTSSDLNYNATDALKLNGSTIQDSDSLNAVLTLPALANSNSLAGSKNIKIDNAKPVVTVSGITGTGTRKVSATDVDASTTTMKYKIQATNTCSDTVPDDATSYTEGC